MKLVINKCFGGFGLSPKATARIAELRGQKAYFFTGGFGSRPRTQVPMEEVSGMFWSAYNTPTPTESPSAEVWAAMPIDERKELNAKMGEESVDDCRKDRANPLLVQVVEELGDAASGDCGKLRIVEIPDGTEYEIDEYDGQESVHEKHQSWS
jgi:hypothetical protein